MIPYRKIVTNILDENINWLENTYAMVGNQVEVEPVGYRQVGEDEAHVYFHFNNKGLANQMINDYKLKFGQNVTVMSGDSESQNVKINGLKRREQQIIGFPVKLNGGVRSSLSAECVQNGCSDISVAMSKPEFSNFIQNA